MVVIYVDYLNYLTKINPQILTLCLTVKLNLIQEKNMKKKKNPILTFPNLGKCRIGSN
jgi:hypothetical protein